MQALLLEKLNWDEVFSLGGLTTGIGVLVVFLLLVVLIVVISLVSKILMIANGKKTEKKKEVKQVEVQKPVPVLNETDPRLIAAITAAIMCMYNEEAPAGERPEFIVRSIRRIVR